MTPRKAPPPRQKDEPFLEYVSFRATRWVGSTASLIFHTIIFAGSLALYFFGVDFEVILLSLTTVVSLEAIYLSIFIQMSVNRQTKQLREVSKDIDEIQEDVEEMQEDVEEIQEDIDEIQEDVEEIQEEEEVDGGDESSAVSEEVLLRIEHSLKELGQEIAEMKRRGHHNTSNRSILGE
ncbi:MAG: DUF1003 domain-containing protein [Candidatus Pacebacteria bacterium]|nr:DUF1003 domain-containing protein [Candidatus Paceibacterota bacterium]